MAVELFANTPSTTVTSGGTDAPASGTQETWTVASSAQFPAAASPASQFHAGDPQFPSEIIAVTNVSGGTWTVTRGAEGTIPVQHAAGFTVWQVTSAGILGIFAQTGAGDLGGTGDDPEVTGTHLTDPLPLIQGGTGVDAASNSALLAALGAAPLASPEFTGTPTAPTAAALTDDTQLATTAYADSAVAVETTRAEAAETALLPLPGAASNLLSNPDFATSSGGVGTDWTSEQTTAGTPTFTVGTLGGLDGGNAQRIQYTGQSGDTSSSKAEVFQAVYAGFTISQPMTFQAYASGSVTGTGDSAVIGLEAFDADNNFLGNWITECAVTAYPQPFQAVCPSIPADTAAVVAFFMGYQLGPDAAVDIRVTDTVLISGLFPAAGQVPVATGDGTATDWTTLPQIDQVATDIQPVGVQAAGDSGEAADARHVHPFAHGEPLQYGEAIYLRAAMSGTVTLTSGHMQLSYWVAATSGTATLITTQTLGTGASGLTYAAIGVYSVDASGNLTLIGATDDLHASLWQITYNSYVSTLTTHAPRTAGNLYAVGCLPVGDTPPTLAGAPFSTFFTIPPILAGVVTGLSVLPSTVATADVETAFQMAEAVVAP